MPNLTLEERLQHYFLAMGAERIDSAGTPANLSFSLGTNKIHVITLKITDIGDRGKILGSVLRLATLRNPSNLLYMAAPTIVGTTINSEVLREHGIGLVLFDERRIHEAVAPTPQPASSVAHQPATQAMVVEFEELKSMITEMNNELNELREQVRNLSSMPIAPAPPQRIHRSQTEQTPIVTPDNNLPYFLSNNPWLEVLSKRGRDGEHIAA